MNSTDLYIYVATGRRPNAAALERKAPVAPRGVIAAASRELGVTREHLSRVLHGHRASRSLTAHYNALRATYGNGGAL